MEVKILYQMKINISDTPYQKTKPSQTAFRKIQNFVFWNSWSNDSVRGLCDGITYLKFRQFLFVNYFYAAKVRKPMKISQIFYIFFFFFLLLLDISTYIFILLLLISYDFQINCDMFSNENTAQNLIHLRV